MPRNADPDAPVPQQPEQPQQPPPAPKAPPAAPQPQPPPSTPPRPSSQHIGRQPPGVDRIHPAVTAADIGAR